MLTLNSHVEELFYTYSKGNPGSLFNSYDGL